jgi:hypothetical protein
MVFCFGVFDKFDGGVLIFPHLPHFPRVVIGVSRLKAVLLSTPHEEFEED